MQTPVLLLIFNRADQTARVMETLRRAQPPRLYVAGDGPRADRANDARMVARAREAALAVDWPCEVKTLFRDTNKGSKYAIVEAIDWFFATEASGIILEDDIVAQPSFFAFCEEMLARYADDARVMGITGLNPVPDRTHTRYSYTFSRYCTIWGWASWARAWRGYDIELESWGGAESQQLLLDRLNGHKPAANFWSARLDEVASRQVNSAWDYQWVWHILRRNGYGIVPRTNLIENIGFGANATHTTRAPDWFQKAKPVNLVFPLEHPPELVHSTAYDRAIERRAYRTSVVNRILTGVPGARQTARALRSAIRSVRRPNIE